MPSCAIKFCKNRSTFKNKSCGITFHQFPREYMWREKWVEVVRDNINKMDWLPSKFSVICSVHFDNNDLYNTKGGLRRIKKNAIPTKILFVNSEWCQVEQPDIQLESHVPKLNTECDTAMQEDASIILDNKSDRPTEHFLMTKEQNNYNEPEIIIDTEIESIFDSPRTEKLKQRVKKFEMLYRIHTKKIKILNQKVRRLQKKTQSLKSLLRNFKDKKMLSRKIKCDDCISRLLTSEKLDFHELIKLRDKGGLSYLSSDTYSISMK